MYWGKPVYVYQAVHRGKIVEGKIVVIFIAGGNMGKFSDITKFMLFNLYIGIDYTGIRNGIYINGGFPLMEFGSQIFLKFR